MKAGDLIAVVDPRPFQAALDQAIAKKAQDEAQLANARVVLERNTDLLKKKVIAQQDFDASKYSGDSLQAAVQGDQAAIESARARNSTTRRSNHQSMDALAFDSSMSAISSTQVIRLAWSSSRKCIRFRLSSRYRNRIYRKF